jgi:hypothetical protein
MDTEMSPQQPQQDENQLQKTYAIAEQQLSRWAELCAKGHGAEVAAEIGRVIEAGVALTTHTEHWWLHRLDMEKSQAWQDGYEKRLRREPASGDVHSTPEAAGKGGA